MATETKTDIKTEQTISEQFEQLIVDVTKWQSMGKTLANTIKVIQKDVAKTTKINSKGKRTRTPRAPTDPDVEKKPSALQIPVKISDELCTFLGFEVGTEHSRREVTDTINKYIKDNDLQNPENRRYILMSGTPASDAICKLLREPDQPVTFFNIQRYLKPHYPPSAKDLKALAASEATDTPTYAPVAARAEQDGVPRVIGVIGSVPDVVPDADMVETGSPDVSPDSKPVKKVARRVISRKNAA